MNIKREIQKSLKYFLPLINKDLINLWNGSKKALKSKNPDRVRHFGISIRELFTNVLHYLAPDKQIKKWSSKNKYYYNGRPTREARLNFICKNINNGTFSQFIEKDIDALLEFIDLFQNCTHSIKPNINDEQLNAMQCRAESTIKYLIIISNTKSALKTFNH